uniref:atrial natriuretic peptide receptor 3-like n=1 Tax=Ciona intestinalis TaxID=7719 RepID=UPI000180B903|nr:atrial natriuretic peptide receptor 3-like [Ciona intestinalis]|eukprot:XP_002122873.3 atrial natriuretic peptide receptor 3-like [Ciona intestinalis]
MFIQHSKIFKCVLAFVMCSQIPSGLPQPSGENPDPPQTVNVVVMVPFEGEYLFRRDVIQPGVEYALRTLRRNDGPLTRDLQFNVTYRNSQCNRKAALEAVDFYYGQCGTSDVTNSMTSPLLFLGPVCNDATSMVATFAGKWNVPVISPGSHAAWIIPGEEYPMLTRITPSYIDLAYFIHNVFVMLNHGVTYPVHLIYEDREEGKTTESECHNLMQAVYSVFHNDAVVLQVTTRHAISDVTFHAESFIADIGYPNVVLMCASSPLVRKVMLAASAHGVAVPGRNEWYAIDLHNDSYYAAGAWKQGDEQDLKAKIAYRALQVITFIVTKTPEFNRFSTTILNEYRSRGVTHSETQVNEYVEGFHDAIMLYARALNATMNQGLDIRNGTSVSANMRNITFQGISGPVTIDLYGDRNGDYSIIGMKNIETGTFEKVIDYYGGSRSRFTFYPGKNRDTKIKPFRMPPFSEPVKEDTDFNHKALAGVLGTLAGVVMCCLLVGGPLCYRTKCSSSHNNDGMSVPGFNHNQPDAVHIPLREDGSVSTCMSGLDDDMKV